MCRSECAPHRQGRLPQPPGPATALLPPPPPRRGEAGRRSLDVTGEVRFAIGSGKLAPARVAGIDLGIIHPYGVMAGDEGLLVSGRAIRAEERLHLEDPKRRAQTAPARAPGKG